MEAYYKYLSKVQIIKYQKVLIYLLAFSLPVHQKTSTIIIVILTILSVCTLIRKRKSISKAYLLLILLLVYYFFCGLAEGYKSAMHSLELKSSLIAMPLIFSSFNVSLLRCKKILIYFAYGCIASYIIGFLVSIYINAIDVNAITQLQRNYFHYVKMWHFKINYHWMYSMDASYYALYNIIAFVSVVSFKKQFSKPYFYVLNLILITAIIQVNSFYGYFMLIIIILLLCIKTVLKSYPKIQHISFLIFLVTLFSLPFILKNKDLVLKRAIVWNNNIEVINQTPFMGYGPIKAQAVLDATYIKNNNPDFTDLNSHNQFFQMIFDGGFPFLILLGLVLILLYRITIPFKNSFDFVFSTFFILIFSLFVIESALNRYSGISAFSFFLCLAINYNEQKRNIG